ncbi:hypothetical protein [Jannaschia rubra]|uniref:hypothetical protein n=1 Tax=Jannaschia rubra TaxID=282197 RepID=UPI00248FC889|nr:hypothetical protein [Jannaschia rubra]
MKTFLAAALLALGTLPATAGIATGPAAAIAHFNMDADSQEDRITPVAVDASAAMASTRAARTLAVQDHFNRDADTANGHRGLNGTTSVAGAPAHGADIFARIRAAQAEDE